MAYTYYHFSGRYVPYIRDDSDYVGADPDANALLTNAKVVIQAAVQNSGPQNVLQIILRVINTTTGKNYSGITSDAVKEFQRKVNLTADGIVGPKTSAALAERTTLEEKKAIWNVSNPQNKGVLERVYDSVAQTAGLTNEILNIVNQLKDLLGGGGSGTTVTIPTFGGVNVLPPPTGSGGGGSSSATQQKSGPNWGLIVPLGLAGIMAVVMGVLLLKEK